MGCGGVLFFKALVLILGFFFLCVFMDCQKKRRFLGVMGGGGGQLLELFLPLLSHFLYSEMVKYFIQSHLKKSI